MSPKRVFRRFLNVEDGREADLNGGSVRGVNLSVCENGRWDFKEGSKANEEIGVTSFRQYSFTATFFSCDIPAVVMSVCIHNGLLLFKGY